MAGAEPTLVRGIERHDEFTVQAPLTTDVGGTIGASVLSTPGTIGRMEGTSSMLASSPSTSSAEGRISKS